MMLLRGPTALFAIILFAAAAGPVAAAEITLSCGAVGQEQTLCEREARAWADGTPHTVRVVSPPDRTNERYFQYLLALGEGSSDVDIYQIDVIWPGLLAEFFVDLRDYIDAGTIDRHLPAIIENNTVDGRLVGMPWYTDVGLLYYRRDLLEAHDLAVPTTWSELTETALYLQDRQRADGNEAFWGFVFQGAPYEGLTVNALEWLHAHGGGTLVDADGDIDLDTTHAALALGRAATWVGTVAPPRVTTFAEEDARITFQRGNAAFMRNWPYAWALLNSEGSPVAERVGVAPLPRGTLDGERTSVLGGWQLAVSRHSPNPAVAAELVAHLTSPAVQKRRAIEGSYAPTIPALYEDPEVLAANPLFEQLPPVLERALARPAGVTRQGYMAVSARFWEAVSRVLQGTASPHAALAGLRDQIALIRARPDSGW